jgi:hypothetical protein
VGAEPIAPAEAYWIFAKQKKGKYPKPTPKSGKWLIFVNEADVDAMWSKIKKAVENGLLGERAKVSTARPNPNARDASRRVICVYTYNYEDGADVRRIRTELRHLGVGEKIPYKADEDTRAGRYRAKGHSKISKFFD